MRFFLILKGSIYDGKQNIDWANIGFGYMPIGERFVANYKDGKWDNGSMTADTTITISECAGVLQYAQTCFEGMKAYTTCDGRIVVFRPDLNGQRMEDSCKRLEMPVFPKESLLRLFAMLLRQMPIMFLRTAQAQHFIFVRICSAAVL